MEHFFFLLTYTYEIRYVSIIYTYIYICIYIVVYYYIYCIISYRLCLSKSNNYDVYRHNYTLLYISGAGEKKAEKNRWQFASVSIDNQFKDIFPENQINDHGAYHKDRFFSSLFRFYFFFLYIYFLFLLQRREISGAYNL